MDGLQDETKQGGEATTQQPGAQDDGCGEEAELRRWREIAGLDEK